MNKTQELYLQMIKEVYSPAFNGELISESLQAHEGIIRAFIPANSKGSLRSLYRLSQGLSEIDLIYLLIHKYDADVVDRIVKEWRPHTVTKLEGSEISGPAGITSWNTDNALVVRVYWDI